MTLPQQNLCDQRNKVVEQMILTIGYKLKQKNLTIHLAIKIFDLVFVHQQQFGNDHEKAVESALSLSHLSKDSLKGLRNEEKNLQLLAAQSLLLASKFIEKSRIFPAEIVYQVRGWGRDDFEMLKSGHIEEYILTVVDFDLIMLSPADFIEFFMGTWSQTIPKGNCEKHGTNSKLNQLFRSEIEIKKLHLFAQ